MPTNDPHSLRKASHFNTPIMLWTPFQDSVDASKASGYNSTSTKQNSKLLCTSKSTQTPSDFCFLAVFMYGRSTNSFCASLWSIVPRLICPGKNSKVMSAQDLQKASNSTAIARYVRAFLHLVQSQLKTGPNLLQVNGFGATMFFIDVMPAIIRETKGRLHQNIE